MFNRLWIGGILALAFINFSTACQSGSSDARKADSSPGSTELAVIAKGAIAPNFSYKDLNGQMRSLKEFQGKTVLLNFWATWCAPCVAEMGSLERLYKTYKDRDFEIVGINVDAEESSEAVSQFVKDKGITFTVLRDSELSLPPVYGLTGFPETFFVGKVGEFLTLRDPSAGSETVRVLGDRPWDSPAFIRSVGDMLAN